MAKANRFPDHARRVTTFAELQQYATAFAAQRLNLVFVIGPPGTGKTRTLAEAVGDDAYLISGSATAFGVYVAAYEHRDQLLILDDVDGLYRDRAGLRLCKCLCQTDPVKRVSWQTDAATLDRKGIPREFTTSSRVAIIANQWRSLNDDVAALEDRGHVIHFDPTPLEVHKQVGLWYWDQQVYDLVAENLHLMEQHSMRTYVLSWELKTAGLDWRAAIFGRFLSGAALEVAKLRADPSFDTEEARARAFIQAGHGCRATYFNYAKKLAPVVEIPQIVLTATAPPKPSNSTETLTEMLRRRHGRLGNG